MVARGLGDFAANTAPQWSPGLRCRYSSEPLGSSVRSIGGHSPVKLSSLALWNLTHGVKCVTESRQSPFTEAVLTQPKGRSVWSICHLPFQSLP